MNIKQYNGPTKLLILQDPAISSIHIYSNRHLILDLVAFYQKWRISQNKFYFMFLVFKGTFINLHYSNMNLLKQFIRSKSKIKGALLYDPPIHIYITIWALHLFQASALITTYFQIACLLIYHIYICVCLFFFV